MNKDLSLHQALKLLDYLKNSSGKETSNVEILCGLILCFCFMYLELITDEMQKK